MNYAVGELESLARKAAKGAGFTWGEAEEAGQAVRILAASGLPATEEFAEYLLKLEAGNATADTCPIRLGCQLVDGAKLHAFASQNPLLLMPFVARMAAHQKRALTLSGEGFSATAGPDLAIKVSAEAVVCHDLQLAVASAKPSLTRVYRAQPASEAIAQLARFAQRTYAPETEARKMSGAGAGDDGNS